MEGSRINELLANGYFKTKNSRERSPNPSSQPPIPSTSNAPSFLTTHHAPRERSRSRTRHRGPAPPRPTVEDELVALARETRSPIPSYDPPLRGKVDQNPIILEAEVTAAEAAILQEIPCPKDEHGNPERRFVFIPRPDTPTSSDEERKRGQKPREHGKRTEEVRQESTREKPVRGEHARYEQGKYNPKREDQWEERREDTTRKDTLKPGEKPARRESFRRERDVKIDQPHPPPIERRRSRQDLPTLDTNKVQREIPPKFRRSASAFATSPRDGDTPKASATTRTPGEYFLSPEAIRPNKEYFAQATPRPHDGMQNGTSDKRNSGSISRPGTPSSDKRNSGNFEKLTRPQQLAEEVGKRRERRHSPDRSGRSSRSSTHRKSYYSSSEDDIADSDSEKHSKRHLGHLGRAEQHFRSPSKSNRSSMDLKGSRLSSPLPSPRVSPSQIPRGDHIEKAATFPQSHTKRSSREVSPFSADKDTPRAERLNPMNVRRPISRQSSNEPIPPKPPIAKATLPIPIPSRIDLQSPSDTRRPAPLDEPRQQPNSWQPQPWQPPTSNLDPPVGSYRRYSEDIERGSVAPLPSCPRTHFTRGRNDWLTLPQCPSFDICPSCFSSIIAPTEFRHMFIPAPRRSSDVEVLCDFGSSPWYRIAWLLTIKERRRDLNLFYGLANIADKYPPCLGKHEAIRQWHSVIDYKTGAPVRGFDVCYSCVKSVETLLPAIRGVFVRTDNSSSPRICDLRFDSKRFVQYFDALETTADRAAYRSESPDTRDLASLARRLAAFEECHQDKDLLDRRWHVITQLPEFTVCEECYDEVVWPELEEGKAIPAMFNKALQRVPKTSCQLYSAKMRGIFRLAVDSRDYKMLAAKARERRAVEAKWKAGVAELRRAKGDKALVREVERLEEEWRRWE